MISIGIRPARSGDAATVAHYHDRCFAHTYASQLRHGELRAPDLDGMREQLAGWFQPGSGFETHVAVIDDVPIGHVTVYGNHLVHLFVEPDHHGIGLGRQLLALGESMIAAGGHTELELHVRTDNLAAIAFYEGHGWTMTDRRLHTVEHGIGYDEHVLVKSASDVSREG